MNQSRSFVRALCLQSIVVFVLSVAAFGQAEAPKLIDSYEVSLHVVVGSNEPGSKSELPAGLAAISRHLKNNFAFTDYRLANTFLGRISNKGTLEYKSVSNVFGQETDTETRTFLEWSFWNMQMMSNGFQVQTFRFGAKIPIRSVAVKDDRTNPVIAYEPVGLTVNTIGIPLNKPTLLGTISLPKTTGTIFLVATIRSAEM